MHENEVTAAGLSNLNTVTPRHGFQRFHTPVAWIGPHPLQKLPCFGHTLKDTTGSIIRQLRTAEKRTRFAGVFNLKCSERQGMEPLNTLKAPKNNDSNSVSSVYSVAQAFPPSHIPAFPLTPQGCAQAPTTSGTRVLKL